MPKPTTDPTRFDVIISYFDRRKDDNVPEDAPREIEIDLDLKNHDCKFDDRPDRAQILKRAQELVAERCDVRLVREAHIRWPYTGCVIEPLHIPRDSALVAD